MGKSRKAMEERPAEVKAGEKSCLDVADEIGAQMVYLLEIVNLVRFASTNKAPESIPLSNIMDDIFNRLERLQGAISELQEFCSE